MAVPSQKEDSRKTGVISGKRAIIGDGAQFG